MSNQQSIMFSLGFSTKFAQYLCVDRGEVSSETLYDSSTELLLVFNCPMPQGLLGARWAGLNLFSRGDEERLVTEHLRCRVPVQRKEMERCLPRKQWGVE